MKKYQFLSNTLNRDVLLNTAKLSSAFYASNTIKVNVSYMCQEKKIQLLKNYLEILTVFRKP